MPRSSQLVTLDSVKNCKDAFIHGAQIKLPEGVYAVCGNKAYRWIPHGAGGTCTLEKLEPATWVWTNDEFLYQDVPSHMLYKYDTSDQKIDAGCHKLQCTARLDSGAGGNFIHLRYALDNNIPSSTKSTPFDMETVDSLPLSSGLATHETIELEIIIEPGHHMIKAFQSMNTNYEKLIEANKENPVKVIILCGTYHDQIFESSFSKWLSHVTMIFTPSWGPNIVLIEKYPEIFNGSLSLETFSKHNAKLKHFIDGFYPLNYPEDLLLENLWMTIFHCASGKKEKDKLYEKIYEISLHNCTGRERIKDTWNYLHDTIYDPVFNAVFIMVNALHQIHYSQDNRSRTNASYQFQVLQALMHLKVFGELIFQRNGEISEDYEIHNHIIVNQTLFSSIVGYSLSEILYKHNMAGIYINASLIQWKTINNEIPKARCTESCPPGSRKLTLVKRSSCCYGCIPCFEGEMSNKSDSEKCRRCPDHEWPNENKTQCVPKLLEFLSFSDDVISVIVLSGSMLLLTLTAGILGIFIKYQDTPIVRANNKNLSFVLLVSIMFSFLCVFLFLGRPVDGTCVLRQISAGILLSVSVSSLLAKTIMVCIAFKATKPGSVCRRWTGVKLSNFVLLICCSVQVVLCMSWVTFSPPFQEQDMHSYKKKIIVQCNEGSDLCFYSVLGYMGILAAISFITAFLVRTLPDSFNEAKYITFSMLVFCSVWIAMIPAYLSTKGKYMVAVEIFAILTSNAGLLGCIFFPKCYSILCRPEINTKSYILKCRIP
ncbi:vomeronasal type-2 receptor 26-like [Eleutherodactylus coqui]|uniref:vomeronasal type-2 receptor 26-like n=1 Tax=Eleutherodactylus coqui TaxID=57060 RepID=UPI0034617FBB